MSIEVAVQRLPHGDGLALPAYASAGAAGADLLAAVADPVVLAPGERAAIPSGIALALPQGFEAQVRPRSGLALDHGVTVLNAPGTVDADYRGEIKVILVNLGRSPFVIERGMRIAQIVVTRIEAVRWRMSESLPASARGPSGFGSSGLGGSG
ncbi:MAG: deoxyuridine 5'-triphosphate nucleotidohydrolase [Rhodospirillales bacterium RIFCSPLOWO2_12_FULL_67_15]|nr:MAG: deoxyuridine 5'-triphosphate nucleotidohydrolase [Rhodospirillales bacterium RIFCSPLOWO2_12_FULL_67_15]